MPKNRGFIRRLERENYLLKRQNEKRENWANDKSPFMKDKIARMNSDNQRKIDNNNFRINNEKKR